MTGKMTLPKAESWWMKYPRLVLLASSTADCRPPAHSLTGGDGAGELTEELTEPLLPDLSSKLFFCLSRSSRILRC